MYYICNHKLNYGKYMFSKDISFIQKSNKKKKIQRINIQT